MATIKKTAAAESKQALAKKQVADLKARGAVLEKREDAHGMTRGGWWLDGVFLGTDCRSALEAIEG